MSNEEEVYLHIVGSEDQPRVQPLEELVQQVSTTQDVERGDPPSNQLADPVAPLITEIKARDEAVHLQEELMHRSAKRSRRRNQIPIRDTIGDLHSLLRHVASNVEDIRNKMDFVPWGGVRGTQVVNPDLNAGYQDPVPPPRYIDEGTLHYIRETEERDRRLAPKTPRYALPPREGWEKIRPLQRRRTDGGGTWPDIPVEGKFTLW